MVIFILKDNIMAFRTKLDYSDNRQINQRQRTFTNLEGGSIFGVAFSGLSSGVDSTTSGDTEEHVDVVTTFSSNTATTIFTWYDSRMNVGEASLSAITPSTSAITQNVLEFDVSSSTTIDGNLVNLSYTGISYDLYVVTITPTGPNSWIGTLKSDVFLLHFNGDKRNNRV